MMRRRFQRTLWLLVTAGLLLGGCMGSGGGAEPVEEQPASAPPAGAPSADGTPQAESAAEPAAAKTAFDQPSRVYYEIFVRSFYDSDGDGIGDLNGVTEKLDYLTDLGVQGIWLMPVNPSPSYHGYDVTDYYGIHPDYGTLEDMKRLVEEAHKRDIRVLMDLVVNHTSVKHPWFIESAAGEDSAKRDWYVWADEATKTGEGSATGASKAWHPKGDSYYLGAFWDGMPDLNFDHPDVRAEMIAVGRYWLNLGVDGFRLDAAKHIYDNVASDKNKPETKEKNVAWWQQFRAAMEAEKPGVTLIGEVWDTPAVVAPYLDRAMSSAFNFELARRILDMAKSESGSNLAFTLERIYALYQEASGGAFADSIFLANHDQNRVMSVLGGNENHARTAAAVLLTLPGNPFLYYGEELGMQGMKPDEHIREPLPWTADRSAPGNTSWIVPKYVQDGAISAEALAAQPDSLYAHYKRLIAYRKTDRALHEGGIATFDLDQDGIESYVRATADGETSLIVHNLSGDAQSVTLPASEGGQRFGTLAFATSEDAKIEGDALALPPYSTAVLKP
ncbi:alpha-amylase family glycosyl hydrolase [Paenibacillus sp.]|uniref:alpha-amylase family glycosyl hydrolase n=1 Tax=Paenibacillus sp. TaxID=58172 RepID=UPI002D39E7C5|nr:alpha-amylase family glycosyl hydrolase [Paenibacillus sp.]HZG86341.1 alpha-amylase family glycosyl hydrolase [Paenibacillus sp.]